MQNVDIEQAPSLLPQLVEAIERRQTPEIIITRSGLPVAKLVPVDPTGARLGSAAGIFKVPDTFDEADDEIARLFYGSDPSNT